MNIAGLNWRDIPVSDVDWRVGIQRNWRTPHSLYLRCSPKHEGEWCGLTLGQLADMGERAWRWTPGVGSRTTDTIKIVIDMAAEGKCVTRNPVPEPYIPACERMGDAD